MVKNNFKTIVVFRKFKDQGDIVALFPAEVVDLVGHCNSYQHIGQHGAASYRFCMAITQSVKLKEYRALKQELESLGYDLDVRKRYVRPRKTG
jgi:hypothetical protein